MMRVVAEHRSPPFQAVNDLQLVSQQDALSQCRTGVDIFFVFDGGWDHNLRNSEVRWALALEHIKNDRRDTIACVRATGLSSFDEAERVNGAETRSVQKGKLRWAVLLESNSSLPADEMIAVWRRRFQTVLANSIAGAMYSGRRIISSMSHPKVEGSNAFSQQFRMHCRIVLDGKPSEVPVNARLSIANALKFQELHFAAGFFDLQLRRNACIRSLKCLCTGNDYPSVPSFTPCSVMQIPDDTICRFVNNPVYSSDGAFLTPEGVEEERQKTGVPVLKVEAPLRAPKKVVP